MQREMYQNIVVCYSKKHHSALPILPVTPYLCRPKSVFADSLSAAADDVQWDKSNY